MDGPFENFCLRYARLSTELDNGAGNHVNGCHEPCRCVGPPRLCRMLLFQLLKLCNRVLTAPSAYPHSATEEAIAKGETDDVALALTSGCRGTCCRLGIGFRGLGFRVSDLGFRM